MEALVLLCVTKFYIVLHSTTFCMLHSVTYCWTVLGLSHGLFWSKQLLTRFDILMLILIKISLWNWKKYCITLRTENLLSSLNFALYRKIRKRLGNMRNAIRVFGHFKKWPKRVKTKIKVEGLKVVRFSGVCVF